MGVAIPVQGRLKKHAERGGDRPIQIPLVDALPPTRIMQRVLQHHAEVTCMVSVGHPLSDIARRLGLDRKTVCRYWATAFGDATVAAAMLDRLLHRAAVAGIDGPSYRLRCHRNQAETIRAGVNARVS
ncbi:ATP-binding protein [Streptomyces sp. NPDC056660]|uniref:ATP-binding protein n=1 Tax=Streptomyces sp. NPDC056660 TaxID=3345897 RepID=UPI00369BE895